MKKTFYAAALFVLTASAANAQEGFGTSKPDPSSVVDMTATNKGVLFPRVALTSAAVDVPVTSPATGLTVFNTTTTALGTANDVTPGYYYWDSAKWVRLRTSTDPATGIVTAGTNTTITGAGTVASPYQINAKNIYTDNGTITGNRTVTMADNNASLTLQVGSAGDKMLLQRANVSLTSVAPTGRSYVMLQATTSTGVLLPLNISVDGGTKTAEVKTGTAILDLGTTGAADMKFTTNNIQRAVITKDGNFGLGATAPASTLEVAATVSMPIVTTATSLDLSAGNYYTVIYTGGTAAPTFTLPDPATCKGRMYHLVNASIGTDYHDVTLSRPVTLYIDASTGTGGTTTLLTVITYTTASASDPTIGNTAQIQSDGTKWWRIGL